MPADTRERVFDPALADLLLDDRDATDRTGRRPLRLVSGSLLVAVESFRVAIPSYFWRRGHLTLVGKAVVLMVLLASAVIALANLAYGPA